MDLNSKTRVLVTPDDLIGYEIDQRYRLDAIVGGGGMGVVYRTTQRNLNREIAIKLLKLEENEGDHRVERFRREIDIVSQLSHPNIVRVFDSGCDDLLGLHYIAMELVEGVSLDDLMRNNRLKVALALDIAHEVAAGLTEPHKIGIVHRDIKPANVLVTMRSDDTIGVKVVDFGIARAHKGNSKITTTGVVVGSPMYMAPEVARGESLDGRTDLYSLGVMLYEMITGATPFGGSTPVAIMLRHAVEEPPSMADTVPDDFAYPELVVLVDRMLSKERKRRPEDAKEVMRQIDAIRRQYGLGRPRVDSNHTLHDAFAPYLVRHGLAASSTEASGPFDVTVRIDDAPATDTFSGWLVTSDARTALFGGVLNETDAPAPAAGGNNKTIGLIVAVVAVLGVVAAAAAMMHEDPPAEKIGEPPPIVELNPEPTPVEVEPAVVAAPDLGGIADEADATVDVGSEPAVEEPSSEKKPAERPAEKKPVEKKKDEFNKGMEWLHQK